MVLLSPGTEAPDFEAPDQHGKQVRLRDLRGQPVVLYFYPVDDTPGCTKEACAFRDAFPAFQELKAAVLGVSTQGVGSHQRFADKYGLPFTLVADEDKAICKAYGTLGLTGTAKRVTYLIGPDGKVARVWEKVQAATHATEVRGAVEGLQRAA